MSQRLLGFDLGGTSIKFASLQSSQEKYKKNGLSRPIFWMREVIIVDDMIESIQHRLDLLGLAAADFQGIGMGSPGVVDRENGSVIGA